MTTKMMISDSAIFHRDKCDMMRLHGTSDKPMRSMYVHYFDHLSYPLQLKIPVPKTKQKKKNHRLATVRNGLSKSDRLQVHRARREQNDRRLLNWTSKLD